MTPWTYTLLTLINVFSVVIKHINIVSIRPKPVEALWPGAVNQGVLARIVTPAGQWLAA